MNLRGREDGAQPELDDVASLRAAEGGSSRSYVVANTMTKGGSGCRRQGDDVNLVAFHPTGGGAKGLSPSEDVAPGTGTGGNGTVAVASAIGVRRLTPTEAERLQGFPDGWTQLGDTADSKRYSALGDAVTVSVAFWIGQRLADMGGRLPAGAAVPFRRRGGGSEVACVKPHLTRTDREQLRALIDQARRDQLAATAPPPTGTSRRAAYWRAYYHQHRDRILAQRHERRTA